MRHQSYLYELTFLFNFFRVEHLYADTLKQVPTTIFKHIKPVIAVFTTPNADFNVLFNLGKGFRHPDHKFEWTRLEFEDWY